MKYRLLATCSFGLEAIVKQEAIKLGFENIATFDARVYFDGDATDIIKANLWLRSADRVYIVLEEFEAKTFEELFQGVSKIGWSDYIGKNNAFPVTGDSVRSTLFSVSDVQKITKKAIVEKLKLRHNISFFEEDEDKVLVHVAILKDIVSVMINVSGPGLNRRGYRRINAVAPIRETLAAGLLQIARYTDQPMYDAMCGSGTIAIEAAMMRKNIAPGIQRRFAFENYDFLDLSELKNERDSARANVNKEKIEVFASDVDIEVISLANKHAKTAGVFDHISIKKADMKEVLTQDASGILVINPPYSHRMGEKKEVDRLYRKLGNLTISNDSLRTFVITADMGFEKAYGKKADKVRKLYNGSIKCNFYQYFRGKKYR
jgi:putative N6-adenine-specific DNA methylase